MEQDQKSVLYFCMNKSVLSILFLAACAILSVNAARSIVESYNVGSVYQERKKQTEAQYLEVIKKKNELDYINSPFFIEKQLRESLNYFKKGEKLLVFTQNPEESLETDSVQTQESAFIAWLHFLQNGILDPLDESR